MMTHVLLSHLYFTLMTISTMKIKSCNHIATQSNRLTEARYGLTVGEQKVILLLISMISPEDKELRDYEMKVIDFAQIMGLKSHNLYDRLSETLDKLLSRILHIPTDTGYLKIGWVSSAEYVEGKGTIFLSFDKKLNPYLLQLKEQFTKYNLFIVTQFQSAYSVRIYMLLKQYQKIGYREFELDDFRSILGIEEKEYQKFYDFRKRVVNQAKKEFETKNKATGSYNSDITFTLETIRTGRKITRLRFIIKKQSYQEDLPLDLPEPTEKFPAKLALEKHGIGEATAKRFTDEQSEDNILRCISLYEEALQSGKVNNKSGGYLIKMLQAKAGKITEAEKQSEQKKKDKEEERKQAAKQKALEEKTQVLEKQFRIKAVSEFIAMLSEEKTENLLEQARSESPLLRNSIKSLDSSMCLGFLLPRIPGYAKNQKSYVQKNLK